MKDKEKRKGEMKEFLSSQGYIKKVEDLRKRKTSTLGIKLVVAMEIIPEVAQKLGQNPKEIKGLINEILT